MLGNGEESPRQRNLHPTYHYKPTPAIQLASQMSHFNEEGRTSNAFKGNVDPNTIPTVPTTWDTVYDPTHPDADWSGLVSKDAQHRKHNPNHISMQESIEHSEYGIISKEQSHEFARKRNAPEFAAKNAGSLVIGGIDDPVNRYNSSYRRFENHEQTSKEQLTLDKRMNAIRLVAEPAQSRGRQIENNMNNFNTRGFDSTPVDPRKAAPKIGPRTSLLSGLGGKLIADKVVDVPTQEPRQSPRDNGYNQNKLLIVDNYKPFPGYTGSRRY